MSVNDRLFEELLRPVVDSFYNTCRALAATPPEPETRTRRAWLLARLETLEECGDRIARVIEVAEPVWEDMRALAGVSG